MPGYRPDPVFASDHHAQKTGVPDDLPPGLLEEKTRRQDDDQGGHARPPAERMKTSPPGALTTRLVAGGQKPNNTADSQRYRAGLFPLRVLYSPPSRHKTGIADREGDP